MDTKLDINPLALELFDNEELMQYYKDMKAHKKDILEYAKRYYTLLRAAKKLLIERVEDLEYEALIAEEKRLATECGYEPEFIH